MLFSDEIQESARHVRQFTTMSFPYLAAAGDSHECDDDVIFAEFVDLSDASVCHIGHNIDLADCLQAYNIVEAAS